MTRHAIWMFGVLTLAFLVPGTSAFAQAASGIKCKNGSANISTGTGGGSCGNTKLGGVQCGDGTNNAEASCGADGMPKCGPTNGSGSCTVSKKLVKPAGASGAKPVKTGGSSGGPGAAPPSRGGAAPVKPKP